MSLILDALRRAEQERQQGRAPGLDQLPTAPADTRRPIPWPTVVVVGLVVTGAVALGFSLRQGETRPAPTPGNREAGPPALPSAQASSVPPRPVAIESAAAKAKPALQGASNLTSMDDLLEPPAPARSTVTPRPTPAPRPIAPVDLSQKAAGPAPNAESPSPASTRAAAEPIAEPETSPLLDAEDVLMSGPTVTPLRDMPPGYRADFPSLNVDVHVYNEEPQRRFVLLNLRRYREGQTLSEGPKLIEIQPDGIVFDFRGERVLMQLPR